MWIDQLVLGRGYCVKRNEWRVSLQIMLTLCALWGWWGMLYPEFTLTEDTYRVVYEEDAAVPSKSGESVWTENEEAAEESPRELYRRLLHAPKGQVRFRSKLLIQLQKWMEQ